MQTWKTVGRAFRPPLPLSRGSTEILPVRLWAGGGDEPGRARGHPAPRPESPPSRASRFRAGLFLCQGGASPVRDLVWSL